MSQIIYQIILCLLAAAILGFIIGWIFSSFVKNEKHENQMVVIKDKFDGNIEEINKIMSEFDAKERELSIVKKERDTIQREILSSSMDFDDNSNELSKLVDLEYDNKVLTQQIKEQKICDDKNDALKTELESKTEKNLELAQKIDELKEFENGYKNNIHRIAELESQQKNIGNEEITKVELRELEDEKQTLLDKLEKLQKDNDLKVDSLLSENQNLKENIKALEMNNQNLDDEVCKTGKIIKKSDLSLIGLENDKITNIIKNLFK